MNGRRVGGFLRAIREAGFSAIELVVVLVIMTAISAILYSAFALQSDTVARESGNTMTQNDIRGLMGRLVREIQSAGFDPRASRAFGLLEISPQAIRFTTDANRDGVLQTTPSENRGFDLSGGTLRAWEGGTSWRTLATGVETLDLQYLDANGQTTDVFGAVREVRITIGIRSQGRSPDMAAALRSLTANAYVRNQ